MTTTTLLTPGDLTATLARDLDRIGYLSTAKFDPDVLQMIQTFLKTNKAKAFESLIRRTYPDTDKRLSCLSWIGAAYHLERHPELVEQESQ